MNIYDLIYFERRNEEVVFQKSKKRRGIFILSLILGSLGTCLIMSVPFILNLAGATEPGIMTGAYHPMAITGLSVGLFFIIYGVYILLAYTNLRRKVIIRNSN